MTRKDLKDFIHNNCFTKKGRYGFNNRVSKKSWWINKNHTEILDKIISETSFYKGDDIVTRCWFIYHDVFMAPKCVVCGNNTNFNTFSLGFRRTCSNKCATSDPARNNKIKEKLDYVAIQEKVKKTNLEKYGVEHWFQTEQSVEKIKQTKIEKYGCEKYNNPEKSKQTCLEKYGSEYWFTSEPGKKSIEKAREENGGSHHNDLETNIKINNPELLSELNETMSMTEIADLFEVNPRTIKLKLEKFDIQPKFHPNRTCLLQGKLLDEIKEFYDGTINFNDNKVIAPKELDLFFPDKNLAIELNGIYWHSEDGTEPKKYNHLNKMLLCKEQDIDLIQFTDIEYKENKEMIINLIKNRLGMNKKIPARKCVIKTLDNNTRKKFLESNHLQGNINSSISYGLYYQDEIVSVMTFGKSRYNKKYEYELLRFCNKNGLSVIGAANKLFNHFIKDINPDSIISYCDLSKFTGRVYEKMGFLHSHNSSPNYFYYSRHKTLSRYQAQKHKLGNILDNFDQSKSESENMFNHGYRRYWDCGMGVFIWNKPRK